jgi:hypothetical protein
MRITTLNSNFEYRLEDKNTLVNISDTAWKSVMISALKDGSDGISGMKCLVTGENIMLTATEKLKKQYQGEDYMNTDEYTDKEVELEDSFIDFERCGCCHEGFSKSEMVQDVDPKDWICSTCNNVAEILDRVFPD